jgi:hypothetical protein
VAAALERQRLEDGEFQDSLGYTIARPCLKTNETNRMEEC